MANLSSPAEGPICVWTDATRKFAIHIQQEVIGRLATDAWVAFKRVPRRGLEIGGILLGHIDCQDDTTRFWIKGFEPVESEHRSGPSYVLSESDLGHLQETIARNGTSSIGIYRSQTRSERLELQDPDDHLFQQAFAAGDALFLILSAASRTAAFFVRAEGKLKCVYEFALTSSLSAIVTVHECPTPPKLKVPDAVPAEIHAVPAVVVEPVAPPRQEAPGVSRRTVVRPAIPVPRSKKPAWKTRFVWNFSSKDWVLVVAMAGVILSATTSVLSYSLRHPAVPNRPSRQYLLLTAKRTGTALQLMWDRNNSALDTATRAILHIQDGDQQTDRNLSVAELTAGTFLYEPKNADVAFRMDVYSVEPNASGSVQVMNLALRATATQPAPAKANPQPVKPAPIVTIPVQPAKARIETRSEFPTNVIAKPILRENDEVRSTAPGSSYASEADLLPGPSPVSAAPAQSREKATEIADTRQSPQLVALRTSSVERPAVASLPGREPSIWVSAEPLSGSALGQVAGRIPLLRRFKKQPKARMTVNEVQPALTVSDKQALVQPISVSIRVSVEDSGKVTQAEIVEYGNPPSWKLANAALAASRRWTFEPVTAGNTASVNELILHFRFSP
jgi:hypothetical protein